MKERNIFQFNSCDYCVLMLRDWHHNACGWHPIAGTMVDRTESVIDGTASLMDSSVSLSLLVATLVCQQVDRGPATR